MLRLFRRNQTEEAPPTEQPNANFITIHDIVTDGQRIGYVRHIGISPYYNEEVEGIVRVYVCALPQSEQQWADYWTLEDIRLVQDTLQ